MENNFKELKLIDLIGDCGLFVDGDWVETKDQDAAGNIRLIQLADIGDGSFKNKSKRYMNEEKFTQLNCTEIISGDILIARMPDPLGRSCVFPGLKTKSATVVDVAILRVDPKMAFNRYIAYSINSETFRHKIANLVTGTTRKRISRKNLSNLTIHLPLLSEQKHIASILDKANKLIDVRKKTIDLLDEYLKSLFLDMFGDPVTNLKKWKRRKFSEIGTLDRGVSKHRPRNASELIGGSHPLIQTGEVANADLFINTYTQTYSEIGLKQSKKWPAGTLCITIAANIAKTGILEFDSCFPDSIVGFIPNEKITTTIFVHFWLSFLQKILEDSAPESAQKNINLQILRNLDVIVPPIQNQIDFSNKVRNCYLLKQRMKDQLNELEHNFQVLLTNTLKN